MTAEACREWRERLGAYVLGGLPADEQAAVRAHLDGCPACRAEAESLAPLAGLLSMADPAHVATSPPSPPPELADRVADLIGHLRTIRERRTRIRIALGGAAAVGVAVVAALALTSGGGGDDAERVAFDSMPPGIRAGATLQPESFGTEIRMRVSGAHDGALCRVFLLRDGGGRVPAGSFRYRDGGGGAQEAVLTSGLDLSEAKAIGLRAYGHTFVEPLPADGGAHAFLDRSTTEEANA